MNDEKALRARHKEVLDKAEAIHATTENEARGMTVEEKAEFDALMVEAERVKGEIEGIFRAKVAKDALDAAKRYDVPETQRAASTPPPPRNDDGTAVQVEEPHGFAYERGDGIAMICAARIRFAGYEQTKAVRWAEQVFGPQSRQTRALQQSVFTDGGALIPENFSREFIELLRAQAKVRQAGARSVELTNGSYTTPKVTGGATGQWMDAEGANVTPSQPTLGQLKLVEKKYMSLVPFSNDLRKNAAIDAIRVVRDDMVRVTANDEDIAFLKGNGLAGQPKGIYTWVGAAQRANSAGSTLANVRTDIRTALDALDTANAPRSRRAWFLHSRTANYMAWELVDGNSNRAFQSLENATGGTISGDPVFRDNNISITLGGATDTEIYYVEMSECFIGDSMDLEIAIFDNATYADSAGTLRSGISRDESAIRLIRKTDFGMRHAESGFVLEDVTY